MADLKLTQWISEHDFRKLSYLDGSLTKIARKYKLKNNEAAVFTSKGWHRLRLIARLHDKAVMIIPETSKSTLDQLAEWVTLSFRHKIVVLQEYRALQKIA